MLKTYREIFERAIDRALTVKGVDALKKTSLFGSGKITSTQRVEEITAPRFRHVEVDTQSPSFK